MTTAAAGTALGDVDHWEGSVPSQAGSPERWRDGLELDRLTDERQTEDR